MSRRFFNAFLALSLACCSTVVNAQNAQEPPLSEAQREYNAGRYSQAVKALLEAISKSPDDAALHFRLGQSYFELREFAPAAASLERAVQLVPKESEYHDWLGRAYGRKAEESVFLSAITLARKTHKEFETAVQLNPANFEAQRNLIRYEMNAPSFVGGGDDKALKHIDELEKLDALQGQLARGEFFSTKKRMAEADTVYAKILQSGPEKIGVYFEIADYFRDRRNSEKMGESVAAAERIDPNDRRLKFYKGILLVIQGTKPGEAERLLRSYLASVPNNSDLPAHATAREWLGKLYESQGRFTEAAEQYGAALALDPHNKSVEEALKRMQKR